MYWIYNKSVNNANSSLHCNKLCNTLKWSMQMSKLMGNISKTVYGGGGIDIYQKKNSRVLK